MTGTAIRQAGRPVATADGSDMPDGNGPQVVAALPDAPHHSATGVPVRVANVGDTSLSVEIDHAILSRLRFRQLVLVLSLVETGNLHATAKTMNLSQPGATKLLKELEATLKAELFIRLPKGMEPTSVGLEVARYAQIILSDTMRMQDRVNALRKGVAGKVRLGAIMAAIPEVVAGAVQIVSSQTPGLNIELFVATSDHLVSALAEGTLDLVIGRPVDASDHSGLAFEPLNPEDLSIVASRQNPLRSRPNLSLGDLVDSQWILQPRPSPMRLSVELSFARAGLPAPSFRLETSSMLTTTVLVDQADLLAVLPSSVARYYASHGLIAELPVRLDILMGRYGLMWAERGEQDPAVRAMIDILRFEAQRPQALAVDT